MSNYQIVIGRAEEIDFIGVSLGVPAKIDTGAFRSSVHASSVKEQVVDGKKVLKISLLGHKCSPITREIIAERYETVKVRSSNGEESERYEVSLKVKIGPKVFLTSFSLADRSNNVYPVLIGREALRKRYLVDCNKTSVNRAKLAKLFGLPADDAEDSED